MGIKETKTIQYICDRCEKVESAPYSFKKEALVRLEIERASRGYDGAWGGTTVNYKDKWYCNECVKGLQKYLEPVISERYLKKFKKEVGK